MERDFYQFQKRLHYVTQISHDLYILSAPIIIIHHQYQTEELATTKQKTKKNSVHICVS